MESEILASGGEMKSPNAPLPPIPWRDRLTALAQLLLMVPTVVFSIIRRRLTRRCDIPLAVDIKRTLLRGLVDFPASVLMHMLSSEKPDKFFQASRFRAVQAAFGIPVMTPEFCAYWIIKWPEDKTHPVPTGRRIVLFWIHGGAYCGGDAFAGLGSLLRLAELAAEQNIALDIFSLDYTLAPHARFPVQQRQAVAAYRHLLEEAHVDPGCIIIGGESAGGHLALACLLGVARAKLPRPSGGLLLCPWVNMTNTAASFERNRYNDILVKHSLDRCASLALGPDATQECKDLLNFCDSSAGRARWGDVLPARTWMNAGSHDLFIDDIIAFQTARAEEGVDIVLMITDSKTHGWQSVEDWKCSTEYYALAPGENLPVGRMPGAANMMTGLSWVVDK